MLPVSILIYGVFMTHSRGGLLALMAIVVVAMRRRVGTVPSLLIAGTLFGASMALNFTGGRNISAESGSDRTSLWGQGMQILQAHPFFGVGYAQMPEFTDVHLTAHNSLVVCAVELGFIGLFFWCLFLYSTMESALIVSSPYKITEAKLELASLNQFGELVAHNDPANKETINHLGRLVLCLDILLVRRHGGSCLPDGFYQGDGRFPHALAPHPAKYIRI